MNNTREARLIIDKIDAKLGSIEKELKFDKIAIAVGVGLVILGLILLPILAESHPLLTIFITLVIIFGGSIAYTMIKEYRDDLKRFKRLHEGK